MKVTLGQFIWGQLTATVPSVIEKSLEGQTVIVTGANIGMGYETAKHFARMNPGKIILACRDKKRGDDAVLRLKQETGYKGAELWLLDLSDFASVRSFAQRVEKEESRLDVLVENAGIAPLELEMTKDGWERTIQVNDIATSLLAMLLLPHMIHTARTYKTTPRLVVVSSEVHYWTTIPQEVVDHPHPLQKFGKDKEYVASKMPTRYIDSKLLNVMFVRALNERLIGESVIVNTVNPGYCYSGLRRGFKGLRALIDWIMEKALARTAEQGSRSLVWAAIGGEDEKDKLRGAYIDLCSISEASDYVLSDEGRHAQDVLWFDLIKELTNIEPKIQDIVKNSLKV